MMHTQKPLVFEDFCQKGACPLFLSQFDAVGADQLLADRQECCACPAFAIDKERVLVGDVQFFDVAFFVDDAQGLKVLRPNAADHE